MDREEELSALRDAVIGGLSVMILSLRGYGKSSILKFFHEKSLEENVVGVYINCLRIYGGRDLLDIYAENLKGAASIFPQYRGVVQDFVASIPRRVNSKKALELVFSLSSRSNIRFIIFDEISTLLARFGSKTPYRGHGGAKAVAEHIKGLLDTYNVPIIAADTSLESIYALARDYSAPLLKEIKRVIFLGPLSFSASIDLVTNELESRSLILDERSVVKIVEVTYGVPLYILMLMPLVRGGMSPEDIEKILHDELSKGIFNAYFKLLFEKFSPTEQEVLIHISRKISRASDITRRIPGAYPILDTLVRKGVIRKIVKSKKETHYVIMDKLFEAWLQINEFGEYKKVSEQRLKVLSYGFEALMREALFSIGKSITIEDMTRRKVLIGPYKKVIRYEGALGEVDAIAYLDKNTADVFEITIEKADQEKIIQLVRKITIVENMGINVKNGYVVAYGGFTKEAIKKASQLIDGGARIYLLDKTAIKIIAREGGVRLP